MASPDTQEFAPAIEAATPMVRQYLEIKARYPEAILLFRLGDFYEMFFDDARRASEILEITLTSRAKGDDRIPMCGVPYHSARGYIARLVETGLSVAVCDQVEEPGPGKALVRREVTRVITPGMVLDEGLLEARADHFLAAVAPGEGGLGLALLDASTGEFRCAQVAGENVLVEELGRAAPREVIVPKTLEAEPLAALAEKALPGVAVHAWDETAFEFRRAEAALLRQLGVRTLDGFGLGGMRAAVAAAGAALAYLAETQKGTAAHVDRIAVFHPEGHLVLDEATRTNLEIFRTIMGGKKKGSLLGILDRSVTAPGGRTLSRWLSYPLLDVAEIRRRHDAVGELAGRGVLRSELTDALREVQDLERLLGKLSLGAGNARDLRALGTSLSRLPAVAALLATAEAPLLAGLAPELGGLEDLAAELLAAVVDEPPAVTGEGGMFRRGYRPELDELLDLAASGKDFLGRLESRERERTGINSLKVRYNKVFGYYLEVTKPNLHLVPADYVRKQTTANAERFITEDLKTYEEKILGAEEKRIELEKRLFEELRGKVVACASAVRRAASAIGTADALLSFARTAAEYGYVRPEVDEGDVLELVEARHPVVERNLSGEAFVPNDVRLDREKAQVVVITGPNMSGKSTVLRQTALAVLLAQAGSFVPARSARIGLVDRIFCRVGASDNLARGQSTFMVEMVETAAILNGATERSLVILDEIGRGTSTFDGLSIAWAVAEHLHDRIGARTLFATHYHELVELAREKPRVKNCTVAVAEQGGKVIFLRKLVAGGASRSYGIEVAKLAGLPPEVLARAREILRALEANELDPEGRAVFARKGKGRRAPAVDQLGLFAPRPPPGPSVAPEALAVIEELKAVQVERTTPLEALALLDRLRRRLGGPGPA
jgi:DNA mismatch repair protein MutS